MKSMLLQLLLASTLLACTTVLAQDDSCCTITGLDAKRQTVTAIERKTGKFFRFKVSDAATFKSARLCDAFDAPIAEAKKGGPLAADFGNADPDKPCCTLATEVGALGQALGVRAYRSAQGVEVILTELKRTAGETVTARWQYCNGSAQVVRFEAKGCVGMGCTHTPAYGMELLDGATRTKYPMLKDTKNKLVADLHSPDKLRVGPGQVFTTWAKFNAPPESSTKLTVHIPGATEPFEDVPLAP